MQRILNESSFPKYEGNYPKMAPDISPSPASGPDNAWIRFRKPYTMTAAGTIGKTSRPLSNGTLRYW